MATSTSEQFVVGRSSGPWPLVTAGLMLPVVLYALVPSEGYATLTLVICWGAGLLVGLAAQWRVADRWGWWLVALAIVVHTATLMAGLGLLASVLALPLFARGLRRLGTPVEAGIGNILDASVGALAIVMAIWVLGFDASLEGPFVGGFQLSPVSLAVTVTVLAVVLNWVLRHRYLPGHVGLLALGGALGALVPVAYWLGPEGGASVLAAPLAAPLLGTAVLLVAAAALHESATADFTVGSRQAPMGVRLVILVVGVFTPLALQVACAAGSVECGPGVVAFEGLLLACIAARVVEAAVARERSRRAVLSGERRFRALVENAADGVVLIDSAGKVVDANPALERLAGMPVVGRYAARTLRPEDRARMLETFRAAGASPGTIMVADARTVGAPDRQLEVRMVDHRDDPDIGAYVANVRDVTVERAHAEVLRRQASEDSLTGLLNRGAFTERLEAHLRDGRDVAVLFCDLDRLKLVNDIHGHLAGDRMIVEVGRRLQELVGDKALLARVGGDEFLVALMGSEASRAEVVAEQVRLVMRRPVDVGTARVHVSCSIGVAHVTGSGTAEDLITDADAALYRAKTMGRDRVSHFDGALRRHRDSRRLIQSQFPAALAKRQLTVEYQPIVRTEDTQLWGVEALVRWDHPTMGRIHPNDFLHIAEEAGVLSAIGWYVLEEVVLEAARHPDLPRVSVNIAAAQLAESGMARRVLELLHRGDLPPNRLQLEVSEAWLIRGLGSTVAELECLRAAGVRIALDDFGTGYASFSALEALPLDVLKIDRSLLQLGERDGAVLRAIVAMAQQLSLEVVVEGVEAPSELALAASLEATFVQGFHTGRPGPIADVLARHVH